MKELSVNKEACIGCGMCVAIDSEHFEFGDDGLSSVISQDNIDLFLLRLVFLLKLIRKLLLLKV